MYGDFANKLMLEAQRTKQLFHRRNFHGGLPTYHDELVRNVLQEVKQLENNIAYIRQYGSIETDSVSRCQYLVNSLALDRNKRCLMAYHKLRTDILDTMLWEDNNNILGNGNTNHTNNSSNTDSSDANGDKDTNLSHVEQEYKKEYSQLITDLNNGTFTNIDLTGSLLPPSDIFIDVRVLKDAGEIQTEYGTFKLVKDSQFFVRQSDVERLIQQGYLQKI